MIRILHILELDSAKLCWVVFAEIIHNETEGRDYLPGGRAGKMWAQEQWAAWVLAKRRKSEKNETSIQRKAKQGLEKWQNSGQVLSHILHTLFL